MATIGIIAGTGVYDPKILSNIEEEIYESKFGKVKFLKGKYKGHTVLFLNRHGLDHSVPPHLSNYRANIMAMKEKGVDRIIATAAVGSLNRDMKPGELVFPDQFLDFTKSRICTFFDGGENGVVHTDFTEPYCPCLRQLFCDAAKSVGVGYHNGGTYVTTEGPRFETPAEIKMFSILGGDLVGMTSCPEVMLACEIGINYATIAMVTNYAAGISGNPLTHYEVLDIMKRNSVTLKSVLFNVLDNIPENNPNPILPGGEI